MISALLLLAALQDGPFSGWPDSAPVNGNEHETTIGNLRQLTFGGQNAEAYWNSDGTKIVFQSTQPGFPDEQIFTMNADGSGKKLVSSGLGRCTCGYYLPDGSGILFSSTHEKNPGKQAPADMSKGYVWKVNPQFSLYRANPDGTGITKLIDKNAYIAETTVDPQGRYMVFTSDFEGDLEIYRSKLDGSEITRLTNSEGYDGGPFVSWDGEKVLFRRDLLETEEERNDYKALLAEHMVRPSKLEVWVMNADGSDQRQLTKLGAASFAPFLHPDGKTVVFCTNYGDPKGREFNIWAIDLDGTNLRQITFEPDFDGFPMFTKDGKKMIFASNRNGKVRGETNLFTADWKG